MWGMGIAFSVSATLASSLLRAAMVSTMTPSVVSCHDCSLREFSDPRKSALRPRMVSVSGAPRCSISSTVKVPFFIRPLPCQPSHSVNVAPRGGSAICPSVSSSSISSWSASNPRLSVMVRLINRSLKSCVISSLSCLSINAGAIFAPA